jgi:hypothetical protein
MSSEVKMTVTNLVTFQGRIVIPIILVADYTEFRGIHFKRITWKIREFSIWFCQEQGGMLTGCHAGRDHINIVSTCEQKMFHLMTSIPARGWWRVGFVALFGSSGPRPSSPCSHCSGRVSHVDSPFAYRRTHFAPKQLS